MEHSMRSGGPVITEDTSLCFAALNGLPGPYIKVFWRELGLEGKSTKSHARRVCRYTFSPPLHLRFVARRKGPQSHALDGFTTRAAWALCTPVYSSGQGTERILFEGRADGRIVPPRGFPSLKFGWGPDFEADDTGLTYVRVLMFMPRSPWANTLFLRVYGDGGTYKCEGKGK